MPGWLKGIHLIGFAFFLDGTPPAGAADFVPLVERTERLLNTLDTSAVETAAPGEQLLPAMPLRIRNCQGYPYNRDSTAGTGANTLLEDLRRGLQTGLQCLSGRGPMGRLHPYHEYQAHRLLKLFEDEQPKTLQCVEDQMFATAVATSPAPITLDDPLYPQLRLVDHPGVVIDIFRLGGILSRRYNDETYRSFFHLADDQIFEHRNGQPLRPADLHVYRNRPALLFHETVHWLGHEHSAIYPDLAQLYETCCFGGSDYISDPDRNLVHQQTACNILKDDELWSHSHTPYRQMRVWHYKGYGAFKTRMRADYDS